MTTLRVFSGDITTLAAGAIVNAANSTLLGGGGVDGAIHRVGGPAILADCREIVSTHGPCLPGDAVVTSAGELPAGVVIHTVGPLWTEDDADAHSLTLASCYHRSLDLGHDHGVRTIAFPNISTGAYRFPKAIAASVAVGAVLDWLESNPNHDYGEIIFACFDDENRTIYELLLDQQR